MRKRSLAAESSSRWAGAITRTSNDAWELRKRDLHDERAPLRARTQKITRRLAAPVGAKKGKVTGYATQAERSSKQQRLQVLQARLTEIDNRLAKGRMSVTRGGKALARKRHNLAAAGTCEADWRDRWEAERLFVCADGEAAKRLGNETIRWNPADGILEIKLPAPLDWRTGQAGTTAWHDQSCSPTVGMSGKRRLSPAQSDTTSPTTRTSAAGISTPHGKQTPGGARPSRISGAARCWRST